MILSESDARFIYGKYIDLSRTSTMVIRVCSPFREERNASFELNLSNGLWYDYGSGIGGDVLTFISMSEGISIKESFNRYQEILHGGIIINITKKPMRAKDSGHGIAMEVYTREFLENIHKWDSGVLAGRGISESIFRGNGCYMWKNGKSTMVLIGYNGSSSQLIDHYKMFTYKNGKKYVSSRGNVTLYPATSLRHRNIVLCEGEYDCLSMLSAGYVAITGTGGANTFKDEWVWALSNKRISIVYDNDVAGVNGSELVKKSLNEWCKYVYVHCWEDGLPIHYDVGDYISDGKELSELIKFK